MELATVPMPIKLFAIPSVLTIIALIGFLCWDFALRTISTETVQAVYFCYGARPANSKFATKTAKKKEY